MLITAEKGTDIVSCLSASSRTKNLKYISDQMDQIN